MSDDDIWRDEGGEPGRRPGRYESEMDEFDDDEFGGPLFGDEAGSSDAGDPTAEQPISLTGDDTGPLPHWTEPATGEVPKIEAADRTGEHEDVDVWSSFTTESPVWKEGDHVDEPSGVVAASPTDPTGDLTWSDAPAEPADATADPTADTTAEVPADATGDAVFDPSADLDVVDPTGDPSIDPTAGVDADVMAAGAALGAAEATGGPSRITIGTDPSGMPRRADPKRRGAQPQRPPGSGRASSSGDRRNLPMAIATGLVLAAIFIACVLWRPAAVVAFVTVLLGLASIEYYSRVTEKGYRPAVAAGVLGCVAAPLAAYWVGDSSLPLVLAFAFFAGTIGFIGADSIESGPMPNMAITTLGLVWIGLLGAFGALILRWSTFGGGTDWGTDTLVLLAIGVVANDVGAYFVGTAFGRNPLRGWISPNKSVEGFIGGTVLTIAVMLVIGLQDWSDTWSDTWHLLWLALVISIMAPLGDLTESMFKRNLDIKDFGAIIRGHGGVLDRFDGFLFTVPAVYYLMLVLEPWAAGG